MCCTMRCSRFVVHCRIWWRPLKPLCAVLPSSILPWCFLRKFGKPCREIHSVGKTPPTQPHAQWCGKACLASFSVSITWCVSVMFDVLLVLRVVEKHGKNHRLQITHRLQFSEVCYGVSREHLQLWCHVSHCISFEGVFERVLFVPEKHPSRCLVCPWSRPWRLRPQTPSMRNVLTTTEKGF